MIKLSIALTIAGLALLLLSALPGRAPTPAVQPAAPTAVQPAAPTVAPATSTAAGYSQADVAYGKALFSAKGCVTCHHHDAVPGSMFVADSEFPDLTTYRWNADYLRSWLKDPRAIKPSTYMPNLGLKKDEIEALIAFLSGGKG